MRVRQDLAGRQDLGVVDRYQQHEIPQVSVKVTQYDQHRVRCRCGRVHTAVRPRGCPAGIVGYGPNLQAFAVYLMVVHFIPAHRLCRAAGVPDRSRAAVGVRARHAGAHRGAAGRGGQTDPHSDHVGPRGVLRRDPTVGSGRANPSWARRRPSATYWWLHRALHALPAGRP